MNVAFGELVEFAVGGGWGEDQPSDGMVPVRVMRGADFPAAESRDLASAPLRYEPSKKAASRILREGDIVLEVSGGTKDRPTGRSIFASPQLLSSVDDDVIPASFCRLVRINRTKASPAFVYYALQDLYNRGGTWEFQNQSTGIANFQFEMFRERWRLDLPSLFEQQAIAEVLGALDDKIAANSALAERAEGLASLTYDAEVAAWPRVPMSTVLEPILGGTPPRARDEYWSDGDKLWISAGDITSAPNRVVVDTAEKITLGAIANTKAKPLPTGSVILTARGTVGEVARLARPASFNQSCYGFRPDSLPPGLLYFSILRATQRAKAVAHGSVFDTITKATFDHLDMAWDERRAALAEEAIAPILDVVSAAVCENRTLAATRDALLPQLMSGKLRVRDAEDLIVQAGE